ncbi:hypothetical protein MRX96_050509 [Rhipicephalus microplus]
MSAEQQKRRNSRHKDEAELAAEVTSVRPEVVATPGMAPRSSYEVDAAEGPVEGMDLTTGSSKRPRGALDKDGREGDDGRCEGPPSKVTLHRRATLKPKSMLLWFAYRRNFLTPVFVRNGAGGPTTYASNMKREQKDLCLTRRNATGLIFYGITAAWLEYSDALDHCGLGTFPMLTAVKKTLMFFEETYDSPDTYEECLSTDSSTEEGEVTVTL